MAFRARTLARAAAVRTDDVTFAMAFRACALARAAAVRTDDVTFAMAFEAHGRTASARAEAFRARYSTGAEAS